MKAFIIKLFLTILYTSICQNLMADYIIIDSYSNQKHSYKDSSIFIKNQFNEFEKIEINYIKLNNTSNKPILSTINKIIYEKSILEINSADFKLDFLQYSKMAFQVSEFNLNEFREEKYEPEIRSISASITSIYDDLLALRIEYEIFYRYEDTYHKSRSIYNKMYFISLKTGKLYTFKDLIKPEKVSQFENDFKNKVKSSYVSMSNNEEKQVENDEAIEDKSKEIEKIDWNNLFNINDLIVSFTEVGFTFYLPDNYPLTKARSGRELFMFYSTSQLSDFIKPNGPLLRFKNSTNNWKTRLHHINLKNRNTSSIEADWYESQIEFIKIPYSNVKTVTCKEFHISENPDTIARHFTHFTFNDDRKITSINRFEKYFTESKIKLLQKTLIHYNSNGDIFKVINNDDIKINEDVRLYVYDSLTHNLLSYTRINNGETDEYYQYLYRDNLVYEIKANSNLTENNFINIFKLNSFGKIISINSNGQIANSINIYDQDKLLANINVGQYHLDNIINEYDNKGKIKTSELDNRRHLTEYIYNENELLTNVIDRNSREIISEKKYFYDSSGKLIKKLVGDIMYTFEYTY